jgi:ABC-type transporter Mla maintaining outer membrane lipid asymmetry ATPase subunit MlaF
VTRQPVISVRDIVNRFGAQVVHDGVSFDAYPGEVFGIVGGSGSVMFSATVSDENSAPCWNVTP